MVCNELDANFTAGAYESAWCPRVNPQRIRRGLARGLQSRSSGWDGVHTLCLREWVLFSAQSLFPAFHQAPSTHL